MPKPDITPAQILAVIMWVAAQAVAYGWLKSLPSQVVLSGSATIVAAAWKLADAYLRGKRNMAHAMVQSAASTPVAPVAVVTQPPAVS